MAVTVKPTMSLSTNDAGAESVEVDSSPAGAAAGT